MSLAIRFNGQDFQNFTAAKIMLSLDNLCGSFSFVSTASADESFPVPAGALVECLVDGQKVMTGYIDKINGVVWVQGKKTKHSIAVDGRGVLQDVVDSTISGEEYQGNLNFIDMCRYVLDYLGLTDVLVINEAGKIEDFSEDLVSGEKGLTCFEFLKTYAEKRQLLLNEDKNGNLVIQRSSQIIRPVYLRNTKTNRSQNNIKSINFIQDFSKRFGKYSFSSQQNPGLSSETIDPGEIVDQSSGIITDNSIRQTRRLDISSAEDLLEEDLKNRAIWEANIRAARGFNYTCQVAGHLAEDKKPWAINELISVQDDNNHINSELLVKTISFDSVLQKEDVVNTTSLVLCFRNSYQVFIPSENSIDNNIYDEGQIFTNN